MGSVAVLPEISDDLFDRYDRLAKATGRPIDVCMIEALAGSIDLFEREYGILGGSEACGTDEVR